MMAVAQKIWTLHYVKIIRGFVIFFIIVQGREDGSIFLPTLSVPGVVPTLRAQYAWGANFFRDGSALKIS